MAEENKEKEKKEEKEEIKPEMGRMMYYHRRKGPMMVLGLLVFLVVLGGAFMVGRVSGGFHRGTEVKNVRNNGGCGGGMMGGRGGLGQGRTGGQMVGQRYSGSITAVNGNSFTLNSSNKNVTVNIATDTSIYNSDGTIAKQTDLKVGNNVIVSGPSNSNGEINATIIRINS